MSPVTPHPAPDDPEDGLEQPPAASLPLDISDSNFLPPARSEPEDDWDNWEDDEEDDVRPAGPPGPGVLESLAWCAGVLFVHVMGSIACGILLVIWIAVAEGPERLQELMRDQQVFAQTLETDYMGPLIAGQMLFFVLATLAATRLRVGSGMAGKLALRPLHPLQGLLIVLAVLPISFFSSQIYTVGDAAWKELSKHAPGLEALDQLNTMEMLKDLVNLPLPVLMLILAVAPAIGEELVFRGVISRGLLARLGVGWCVAITTVLFAAVHVHPVHALGVIPLGLFMHHVYLTSRSFWAPMLYHFLNNAWAAFAMKHLTDPAAAEEAQALPLLQLALLIGLSALSIGLIGVCLWQSRLYFRRNDSEELYVPAWPTVEHPPADLARPCRDRIHPALGVLTLLAVAGFYAALFLLDGFEAG